MQFASLIAAGLDAWTKAGQLWCRITADNPRAYQDALDAIPDVTREVLESFERIGRREVHPSLVLDGSPGAQRLALLPYEDQARLHRARVPVVVRTAGGPVEREKRVCDLTRPEALRVIGPTGIRSVAEQRRLLLARRHTEGSRTGAARRDHEPDGPVIDVEAVTVESLSDDPKVQLVRSLTKANADLLDARSSLVMVGRREHPLDRHITTALRAIGELRFAINEGEM